MSVVFALTAPFPLFRLKIYKSNSQTFHRQAGKLYTDRNNKLHVSVGVCWTAVGMSYRVLCVWVCVCVCMCVGVCV